MSPVGAIFVPFLPKTGANMLHPLLAPIVELVSMYSNTLPSILLDSKLIPPKTIGKEPFKRQASIRFHASRIKN